MLRPLLVSILFTALTIAIASPVEAGTIDADFATYLADLPDGAFASAIVYLKDQPDIRALDDALRTQGAPMAVRHERVLTTLREAAERSQPALTAYLDGRRTAGAVEGFTPFWIMNMVVVSATKAEIEQIASREDVDYIEANFRATLIDSVDRTDTGPPPILGIGVTNSLKAINAHRVWRELGFTGAGTIIGSLDTGVQGSHPALSARWRGNTEPAQECWRDALGGGTQFPSDGNGHGTHTTGTMCGAGHATGDTVGVAWGALWIADNAINQGVGSAFDNDVLDAFQWFADPDGNPNTLDDVPDVVQNSWGIDARFGGGYQDCDFRWQAVIQNCEAAGVVVTFSSGNEGPGAQTHRSPANIINTPTTNFAVGAVDAESFGFPYPIASFSSRGPSDCDGVTIKPEVVGPGVNVYSSYPNSTYARLSGTSMAGPHVAGVVALMRQANPNADVQTIKTVLMNTARDLGSAGEDNNYGWGVIDAYAAVLAVRAPDNEPPTVTVTAPNGGEVLTVGSVYTIQWNAADNVGVTQSNIAYSTDGGANYTTIASLAGNPGSYNWTVPNTPSTQSLVRVTVSDQAGNQTADVSDAVFTIQAAQGAYVWVANIDLVLQVRGRNTNAMATVLVLDQNGSPAAGAQVQSLWSGLTGDSDVFTTNANGVGTCASNKLRNPAGCWNYTVGNVVLAGYTFRNDLGQTTDTICTGAAAPPLGPSAEASFSISQKPVSAAPGRLEFALDLPAQTHVSFAIYNVLGQKVRTLVDGTLPAGSSTLLWDGTNEDGRELPSGVYMYRVIAGERTASEKVMLFR